MALTSPENVVANQVYDVQKLLLAQRTTLDTAATNVQAALAALATSKSALVAAINAQSTYNAIVIAAADDYKTKYADWKAKQVLWAAAQALLTSYEGQREGLIEQFNRLVAP